MTLSHDIRRTAEHQIAAMEAGPDPMEDVKYPVIRFLRRKENEESMPYSVCL